MNSYQRNLYKIILHYRALDRNIGLGKYEWLNMAEDLTRLVCPTASNKQARDIFSHVCQYASADPYKVMSKCRKRGLVEVRQVICHLLREHTNLSLTSIGKMVGYGDHASVLYAKRTVSNLMESNMEFRDKYSPLIASYEITP
jgi:chromosomal replication initiator protein